MAGLLQCLIQHIKGRILTVGTVTACVLHVKTALVELLKFPFRMIMVLLGRGGEIFDCNWFDDGAIRVPTFYAYPKPKPDVINWKVITLTSIVAMLFGGIHSAGWNFPFPSHAELIIWRVSSLIILIVPCTSMLPAVAFTVNENSISTIAIAFAFFFGVAIYVLARLTLYVEAFIALRHLPPGAYAVVEWTALLLHM